MKHEIYEDSDVEDYPKDICPNLIHRWGWCTFWSICIAWAIIIGFCFTIGNVLE